MEDERLRKTLADLRSQADAAGIRDPAARARLDALIADTERRLADPAAHAGHQGLLDAFAASVLEFEAEHPSVAGTLNQLMTMLSSMGI